MTECSHRHITAIDLYGVMELPVIDGERPLPAFAIAWDPQLLSPEEYAELVDILGDLARASGGAGVRRVSESEVQHTVVGDT